MSATAAEATSQQGEVNFADYIISEGRMVLDDSQVPHTKGLLSEFAQQVLASDEKTLGDDLIAFLTERIADIDAEVSATLNGVMHHADFQKLESSWRGLNYLVKNAETGENLKIRVLNASKKELLEDIEKASEFDQSGLFKMIYEEEYGTFGGNPYSLLVGDFEFGRHPQDMALLEGISHVAAAAHAPFLAAPSPRLFDMESFTELGNPRDLSKIFEANELTKWRSLRDSEDGKYVVLTLPRVLARLPYGPDTVPVEAFHFVEDANGSDHSKYLWFNSAYAMALRVTKAFSQYSWCAAIRGVEGGGLVDGLPTHTFATLSGDSAIKCPTEIAITDRREKELSDLGFIALCYRKGTDKAAFFGGQTVSKARQYDTPQATANAQLAVQLPYVLAVTRFAHYLKVMMRDKVGKFASLPEISHFLNRWLAEYILLDDNAQFDMKARFPLREGRVDVSEIAGRPGCFRATVFLRPHFQLNELTVSLRLVAELPPPATA
jgi:type VI secretion system protein ImpC